jgi:hypothetical protein
MPEKPISTGGKYIPTSVPGVHRRDARYSVRWNEDGKVHRRSFPTFDAACAFKRDYIVPFRERRGLPPTAVAPGKRGNGWVYAFQARSDAEAVKVGFSTDPASRLRNLTNNSPFPLDLIVLIPGSRETERLLHDRLADYKLRGEWYSREVIPEMTRLIWNTLGEKMVV